MDRKNRIVLATVILAVALACAPLLPQIAPLPNQPAGAVNTIVAGTRAAAGTQTQALLPPTLTPSATRPPTKTPTITPTATATIIFKLPTKIVIPTSTKKSGSGGSGGSGGGGGGGDGGGGGNEDGRYVCKVLSTTIRVGGVIVPGNPPSVPANTNFTVTWLVKNIGVLSWDHNSVDFRYRTGTKFHTQALYDFPDIPPLVSTGETVELVVDNPPLHSPSDPKKYVAYWTLQSSNIRFCDLTIGIVVP